MSGIAAKVLRNYLTVVAFSLMFSCSESDGSVMNLWTVAGGRVLLPCPLTPSVDGDKAVLVLWFKDRSSESIYSYDARREDFTSGRRWQDDVIFGGRAHFTLTTSPPSLILNPSKEEDEGVFTCRVEYTGSPSTFARVNLSVLVPPKSPVIYWDGEEVLGSIVGPIREGETVELICLTKGGRPTPVVSWWRRGTKLEAITEAKMVSGQTVVLSKTTLKGSRSLYGESLECQAMAPSHDANLSQPKTVAISLNMTLPPLTVKITGVSASIAEGTTIQPVCHSVGSHPPASIIWTKDNQRLTRISKSVMDGGNITKASVTIHVTKGDHKNTIGCQAYNPALSDQPDQESGGLSDAVTLDVQFKPSVNLQLGRMLSASNLVEGKDAFFECLVESNPPPHKIEWFHDGKAVEQKNGVVISGANLGLQKLQRAHSGVFQCAATNLQGRAVSQHIEIFIKYAPICAFRANRVQGAVINQKTKIICRVEADPVEDLVFEWNKVLPSGREMRIPDDNVTIEDRPPLSASAGSRSFGSAISYITAVPEHVGEFGKFICRARNAIGSMKEPCVVSLVSAGPPDPPFNCSVTTGAESLTLNCREGFNGGFPQIFLLEAWIGETIFANTTSEFPSWTLEGLSEGIEVVLKIRAANPKGSSDYVSLVAHMPIAHQQSVIEPEEPADLLGPILGAVLGVLSVLTVLLVFVLFSAFRRRQMLTVKSREPAVTAPLVAARKPPTNGPDIVVAITPGVLAPADDVYRDSNSTRKDRSNGDDGDWSDREVRPPIRASIESTESEPSTSSSENLSRPNHKLYRKSVSQEDEINRISSSSHRSTTETQRDLEGKFIEAQKACLATSDISQGAYKRGEEVFYPYEKGERSSAEMPFLKGESWSPQRGRFSPQNCRGRGPTLQLGKSNINGSISNNEDSKKFHYVEGRGKTPFINNRIESTGNRGHRLITRKSDDERESSV